MVKKLTPIGNSLGIVIDRSILDLLGIDRDTPLAVTTDGQGLYMRPVDTAVGQTADHTERVRRSAARMTAIHDETLAKLAK